MKSSFGQSFTLTLFGESHGKCIGFVLDGLPAGIEIALDGVRDALMRRNPEGPLSTARREPDAFDFVSGYVCGHTTGTPLTFIIQNQAQHSADYEASDFLPRPSHADYAAHVKYAGYEDARGGGHFSGRITAPLVAAGEIFTQILRARGITIGAHIARCMQVHDRAWDQSQLVQDMDALLTRSFATLDTQKGAQMQEVILQAKARGDSVGGEIEAVVCGMEAGVGEPFFHSVESVLSHLLYAIPGIKGVQFGDGFALCDMQGSQANDPFALNAQGKVVTLTNRAGGINGGITNAMPIMFSVAVRPTPSIALGQNTVNLTTMHPEILQVRGRHDPAIFPRALEVVRAVTAIGIADLLAMRYGYLWLRGQDV